MILIVNYGVERETETWERFRSPEKGVITPSSKGINACNYRLDAKSSVKTGHRVTITFCFRIAAAER